MKTEGPFHVTRYSTLSQLQDLECEWNEMMNGNPDLPVFLSTEWVNTWWHFFGENRQLWILAVRDETGKLLGIAPFMAERYSKSLIRLDTLALIGTGKVCPTHLAMIAAPEDRLKVCEIALNYLREEDSQRDVLRIGSILVPSSEHSRLLEKGGRIRVDGQVCCRYIMLPGCWDEYTKTMHGKFRRKIQSLKNRLETDYPGAIRFAGTANSAEVDAAMLQLERFIVERCHAKKMKTDWSDTRFAAFQCEIARVAFEKGWLRMNVLRVQDQIIAVDFNFRYGNRLYGYNAGFDSQWRKYSPCHLLHAFSIKSAIEEGVIEMSLGRGDAEYKHEWSSLVRTENEILIGGTARGAAWISIGNFIRNLKHFAKPFKRVIVDHLSS